MKTIYYILIMLLGVIHASAQSFPSYAEHSYWNDSYPIYDAVAYKGKFYALQNHKDGMRLVQFDTDLRSGVLTGDRYWTVGEKGDYDRTDVEIVEYRGSLYIFETRKDYHYISQEYVTARKFYTDANGTGHLSDIPAPSLSISQPNIAATVYKGALCFFYVDSDRVRMRYTTDDPASKNAKWEYCDAIAQRIYAEKMTGQDTWDVCTWYGESEKLVIGLIAGRNMWAYTFDGNLSESENSKWTSVCYENGAPDFGSFSLKLLQGAITGVGSDVNDKAPSDNPVQFIYALQRNIVTDNIHQRQILTNEYYPSANTFGTDAKRDRMSTNLPYGFFGAATLSAPYDGEIYAKDPELGATSTRLHQQYICIFRGACDNHFKGDSHYAFIKSNRLNVTRCSVPSINMLKDPELRKLCTLSGVIEGAPPIIIDNKEMYDKVLNSNDAYLSSITFGNETIKNYSESTTTGFSIEAGLGPDLNAFTLQMIGGYEMQQSIGKDSTFTVTTEESIYNNSPSSAATGYYVYLTPHLLRYSSSYFSPDGSKPIKKRPILYSFVQDKVNSAYIEFKLDDQKIDPAIRVENPMQLESWETRGNQLFNSVPPNEAIFEKKVTTSMGVKQGLTKSVSNSQSSTESFHVGGNLETPALKIEGNYNFSVNKSNTSTMSEKLEINMRPLKKEYLEYCLREKKFCYYYLEGYFLNNMDYAATQTYYNDLIRRGIMLKNEKPFILAWNVSGLSESKLSSAIATSDEAVTPDGTRVYNDGDALSIDTPAGSRVTIFATSGRMEADRVSDGGTVRQPLARGIYFIRVANTAGTKVYKAIKR